MWWLNFSTTTKSAGFLTPFLFFRDKIPKDVGAGSGSGWALGFMGSRVWFRAFFQNISCHNTPTGITRAPHQFPRIPYFYLEVIRDIRNSGTVRTYSLSTIILRRHALILYQVCAIHEWR